jgi:hypothetical protein
MIDVDFLEPVEFEAAGGGYDTTPRARAAT